METSSIFGTEYFSRKRFYGLFSGNATGQRLLMLHFVEHVAWGRDRFGVGSNDQQFQNMLKSSILLVHESRSC